MSSTLSLVDRYCAWIAGCVLSALGVSWVGFQAQQERIAPAVLFPLAVGAAVAGGVLATRRAVRVPARGAAIAVAAALGLLVVFAQDYIGHRHRVRLYDDELARQTSPLGLAAGIETALRPAFGEYLIARMREQPLWFALELAITSLGAASLTALGTRRAITLTTGAE